MAEYVYIILLALIAAALIADVYTRIKMRHSAGNESEDASDDSAPDTTAQPTMDVATRDAGNAYAGMHAPQLAAAILKDLNCHTEKDEEGNLAFDYQGAHFDLFCDDESAFITVAYLWWEVIPLDKLENVSCMQKAVNAINTTLGKVATFYVIDTDNNRMMVGSKYGGLLIPQIPQVKDYFEALLNDLFRSARSVLNRYVTECNKQGVSVNE